MELFKELTDVSRGVRRLGAAAIDLCHVALGIQPSHLHLLIVHAYISMHACMHASHKNICMGFDGA